MTTEPRELAVLDERNLTQSQGIVKSDLPEYWDRDYIHACLNAIDDQYHKLLMTFLWMTGCRITEALNVTKGDLDTKGFLIKIRWLKNRKYNYRFIPMHPILKDLLALYAGNMRADERIFNMSRQRGWQLVQKYFEGHPHKIRHSFAVNWIKCGGEITTLSQVLGHSDIRITMIYLKLAPIDQGEEMLKITF